MGPPDCILEAHGVRLQKPPKRDPEGLTNVREDQVSMSNMRAAKRFGIAHTVVTNHRKAPPAEGFRETLRNTRRSRSLEDESSDHTVFAETASHMQTKDNMSIGRRQHLQDDLVRLRRELAALDGSEPKYAKKPRKHNHRADPTRKDGHYKETLMVSPRGS